MSGLSRLRGFIHCGFIGSRLPRSTEIIFDLARHDYRHNHDA